MWPLCVNLAQIAEYRLLSGRRCLNPTRYKNTPNECIIKRQSIVDNKRDTLIRSSMILNYQILIAIIVTLIHL